MDALCLYNPMQTFEKVWSNLKVYTDVNPRLRVGFT